MDNPSNQLLGTLLNLQNKICTSKTINSFCYSVVNETLYLISYRQAALWRFGTNNKHTIESVSGLPLIDQDAPYIQWLNLICTHLSHKNHTQITPLIPSDFPKTLNIHWNDWFPKHAIWIPLIHPDEQPSTKQPKPMGGLLLAREEPWQEPERVLLNQLALIMVPVWWGLIERQNIWKKIGEKRPKISRLLTVIFLVSILAFPLRQSVLAPAEIVAQNPTIVRAPMDGVVDDFQVVPNQQVTTGQPLLKLDATKLNNKLTVTEKELEMAQAQHRQAVQKALRDPRDKARVAILKGRVEQRMADLVYISQQLERVNLIASRSGVAVFTDKNDWIGKPVNLGERIMMLANPEEVEIEIRLPVDDALTLSPGSDIKLFLAIDPNHPLTATLRYASYRAELSPEGILAYRVKAKLTGSKPPPRLGLRGTAKIYGEEVRLFYYLLRRPLAMARRVLGL